MKGKATSAAASLTALIAAIGGVFAPEIERFNSPTEKIALTLFAAIGLYAVFDGARRVILSWRYRKLLGRWFYATREHEGVRFIDRNVALMEFKFGEDGDLVYRVYLYPNVKALAAAIKGRRQPRQDQQRGSSKSLAMTYDPDARHAEILFRVTYTTGRVEDCDRSGILTLDLCLDGTLKGEYVSQIWEYGGGAAARGLSSGFMYATRDLKDLRAHLVQPEVGQQPAAAAAVQG